MTIAFVGNTSFSLYKFRLGIMMRLKSDGHQVVALAPEDEYSALLMKDGFKYVPIDIDGKGKSIIGDLKLTMSFVALYRDIKPDFVFHYTIKPNIYGTIACGILHIPSIAVTTGLGYAFNKNNLFNLFIKTLYRLSLRMSKEVWFLNHSDKDVFLKNHVIPSKKAFVLPSEGIDSGYYLPRNTESNTVFTFLLLSRLIKEKGIEEYVAASKLLHDRGVKFKAQLLGKQEKESLKCISISTVLEWHESELIDYLGESIDVRSYIAQSDCVVLPSYYMEGVPRCLMEAMSMSKPIITTDNVGCNELVDDGLNGLMCKSRDIEDLANKMEQMVHTSIAKRVEMGENGRRKIENHFDEQRIIEIYLERLKKYTVH